MRASAKTIYAMEAMVDVAIQSQGRPVALRGIAERQEISQNYLEQIFMQLRAAGLVRSVRGAGGGFVLARSPSEIRMAEIAMVFEGPICLVECVDHESRCGRSVSCAIRQVWVEVGECMKKALDSVTLQDVSSLQGARQAGTTPTKYK
jgi:Rrf2 family protein